MNIVEIRQLSKIYGDGDAVKALDKVDLDIEEGKFHAVLGTSGCGKSTLLHILGCPTAHCERYKPHFDFGDIPSPIVPHRNKLQTQGGMTAH